MADPMDVQTTIKPFDGTVNVSFSDAMIASTKNAMMMLQPGKDSVFFIPFEDIYFDFLFSQKPTPRPFRRNSAASAIGVSMR
ncbi:hypothetical protein ACHMW7_23875 [Aminobacter sp. UC22_36]|uniref:hypothetical protein n=1 Tax=Aminobacter sp. UC22_36 TaxID=3374549 RepID=UPI003757890C